MIFLPTNGSVEASVKHLIAYGLFSMNMANFSAEEHYRVCPDSSILGR